MIELPQIILTINPSLLLINSTLEEAQQLEELKLLYGDNWPNVYKEILAKRRLENSYNNKQICNTKELNKKTPNCKCKKEDVCS